MKRLFGLLSAVLLLLVPRGAAAQLRIPAPVGYINDFAHVIPPAARDSMQAIIDEVRAKTGGEIVVVTLPSLQGQIPSDVALEIGRDWKVGKKGPPTDPTRNTGVVILVVPKETSDDHRGHLWIATGTGTTEFITAAQAGRIRDQYMIPSFQRGDYGGGILLGVLGVAQRYALNFNVQLTGVAPPDTTQQAPSGAPGPGAGTILFWIVIGVVALSLFGGRRGGRGGGGGGFMSVLPWLILMNSGHRGSWGGFGGGGFGGGGAGGSW